MYLQMRKMQVPPLIREDPTGCRATERTHYSYGSLPSGARSRQPLIQEDPTCCRATEPVHYSYGSLPSGAWEPRLELARLEPVLCTKRSQSNAKLVTTAMGQPLPSPTRKKPSQQRRPGKAKGEKRYH